MIVSATTTTNLQPEAAPFFNLMKQAANPRIDFHALVRPETPIETRLLSLPELREGYDWGKPRPGHPEGKVGLHVREVLDNVERLDVDETTRRHLRLIAIVHDTFKYKESQLRHTARRKHHGSIAREFVEQSGLINESALLDIIELHDEAYYVWRDSELYHETALATQRMQRLLERLGENLPLYYLFFKCDTETGDKTLMPLRWFEQEFSHLVENAIDH